jgi:hypothetical protein
MSDTENNPQQPEDDEQTSATGETQDESSDLKAPADSDPPIIVHGDNPGNP